MRPVFLQLQAFGPFIEKQSIDFLNFYQSNLLGIYGPTGSGKTSILDAICFALYGTSSGDGRKPENLRSHLADITLDTWVQLVFSIGQKTYFIKRSPGYETLNKRGEGTSKKKAQAELYDLTGLPTEAWGFDQNGIDQKKLLSGLLLESKPTNVTTRIQSLLKFNANQFKQVVLLPQGKFRDFLAAKNSDKSEILRHLFDIRLYEKLEQRLGEITGEIKQERNALEAQQKIYLETVQAENIQTLDEEVKNLADQLEIQQREQQNLGLKKELLMTNLSQSKQLDQRFIQIKEVQNAFSKLLTIEPEIKQKQSELDLVRKAYQIKPDFEVLQRLRKEENLARDLLEKAEIKFLKAEKNLEKEEKNLKKSNTLQEEMTLHELALQHLKQETLYFAQYQTQLNDLKITQSKLQSDKEQAEKIENELKSLQIQWQQTQDLKSQQDENKNLLLQKKLELEKLQAVQLLLLEIDKLDDEIKQFEHVQVKLTKKEIIAKKNQKIALENLEIASRKFEEMAAARLAETLSEDAPCPVCGSTDHPHIADQNLHAIPAADTSDMKEAYETATQQFFALSGELKKTENLCEQTQKLRDIKLKELLAKEHPSSRQQTSKIINSLIEDISFLESTLDVQIDDEQKTQALYQEIETKQAILKKVRQKLENRHLLQTDLQARAQTIRQNLSRNWEAPAEIEQAIKKEEKKLGAATTLRKKSEKNFHEAKLAKENLLGTINEQSRQVTYLTSETSTTGEQVKAQMKLLGFDAQTEIITALKLDKDALHKKIQTFYNQKSKLEEQVNILQKQLSGKDKPDLPALQKEFDKASLKHDEISKRNAGLTVRLEQLRDTRVKLGELNDQHLKCMQHLDEIVHLEEITKGKNTKKTRLTDWILADYFEEILLQANLRFSQLTKGRYLLKRTPNEETRGGGNKGLEISVYDSVADKMRPAITLSGGEEFLASLALALGLSDVIQQESGGVELDAIFIDEGFGNLDEETLHEALEILKQLSDSRRLVGIVSHVEEVKRQIYSGIYVKKTIQGSQIRVRSC